jgi:hypothetical protein
VFGLADFLGYQGTGYLRGLGTARVDTPMVGGLETLEPFLSRNPEPGAIFTNGLTVEALHPRDVSNAVLCGEACDARKALPGKTGRARVIAMADGSERDAVPDRWTADGAVRRRFPRPRR